MFINTHRETYGVEPICKVLRIAPSTYYWHVKRSQEKSKRDLSDERLMAEIQRVYDASDGIYGARKVWRTLTRQHKDLARCTVERLMKRAGLRGVTRCRRVRTTVRSKAECPKDLVQRNFNAEAKNRLWVADLTYVKIASGHVYVAFVTDVFSRRIVGWRVSTSLTSDIAVDALEQALFDRRPKGLIHHSDRGVQYLCVKYSTRLEDAGIQASVGSVGDSYDNALAETINGLYKAEVIHHRNRKWTNVQDVEKATMNWVHWFNHHRIMESLGYLSPAEYEADFSCQAMVA